MPSFQCRDVGPIPGQGTKIPHVEPHNQKKKKKQPTNKNEPTTENQMIKTCVSEMKAKRCYIMYLFRNNTSHIVKVSSIGIYNHWIQKTYTKIYVQNICTEIYVQKIYVQNISNICSFRKSQEIEKIKNLKTIVFISECLFFLPMIRIYNQIFFSTLKMILLFLKIRKYSFWIRNNETERAQQKKELINLRPFESVIKKFGKSF